MVFGNWKMADASKFGRVVKVEIRVSPTTERYYVWPHILHIITVLLDPKYQKGRFY